MEIQQNLFKKNSESKFKKTYATKYELIRM